MFEIAFIITTALLIWLLNEAAIEYISDDSKSSTTLRVYLRVTQCVCVISCAVIAVCGMIKP